MKITTLIENVTYQPGLIGEHGISILIETGGEKILFDTGQSGAFLNNARHMGFDLQDVDHVVISHGHYDHTGGLPEFLKLNSRASVHFKQEALADKLKGNQRHIGLPMDTEILKGRSKLISAPVEMATGVWIMPDIPLSNPDDTGFSGFKVRSGEENIPDEFHDELFLALVQNGRLSIISGCSHRGITNITRYAMDFFDLPVHLIMGGFHLINSPQNRYDHVVELLRRFDPERIGVCHCTGMDRFFDLKSDLGEKVFYNACGTRLVI